MKRFVLALFLLVALPAFAQDAPQLLLDLDETEAIPGQPLRLSLTVLVPSYLPKPPVWPSLELPNVHVRVEATRPASQRMASGTWSGVTRHYLVTPMVPGEFILPQQRLSVIWADPETNEPRQATVMTGEVTFSGVVPPGAEGLSPFLAARSVELSQTIEGRTEALVPGDSVIRTVTATIRGASAMFLPSLLPEHSISGMRAYVSDPVVETLDSDGELSGKRVERVTLIGEGGGSGSAPAVELQWFDLDTQTVQTAHVDSFPLSVDAPPVASAAARQDGTVLLRLAILGGTLIAGLFAVLLALRFGLPPVRRNLSGIRKRWQRSELQGWLSLRRVIRRREYARLRPAIDTWTRRIGATGMGRDRAIRMPLFGLGEARYSTRTGQEQQAWRSIEIRLVQLRRAARASLREGNLPPLNRAP